MPSSSIPTSRERAGASRGLTVPSLGGGSAAPVVLLLCAVAVLAGPVSPAVACDCAGGSAAAHYADADVVFTGTLVSRTGVDGSGSSTALATWVFAVDRALKGSVPAEAVIQSASSGASCGLELTGSGPFAVFARDAGTHLTAELCQGSAQLTPALARELDGLAGSGGAVVPGRGPAPPEGGGRPEPAFLAGTADLLVLLPLVWRVLQGAR